MTEPRATLILSGPAGSGKTAVLHRLAALGEQVLDLEALAYHRGSAFGAWPDRPQPSHEAFGSEALRLWHAFRPDRPSWLEDEGPFIGSVGVPKELADVISTCDTVVLDVPRDVRIARLVRDYEPLGVATLGRCLRAIAPRLGKAVAHQARGSLAAARMHDFVDVLLEYYDAQYEHRTRTLVRPIVLRIAGGALSADAIGDQLAAWVRTRARL